jgi:hypothetical protein
MSNGPPISLPSGFFFDVNNLVWSMNGSNIFVDYHRNDELFINYFSMIKNVFQFHVLSPPKCNPNIFCQFFYPYISLNLDEYHIPSSSCSSIYFSMHPSIINVVFLHLILFFVLFLSMYLLHLIPFFVLPMLLCLVHLTLFSL